MFKNLTRALIQKIAKDRKVRIAIVRKSHRWFFPIYLGKYIRYPSAPFHDELFDLTENESVKNAVVVAFRGSAKSTILTLSYVLWSILGAQQKKFILILAHTMHQARTYMKNIKDELETNTLLQDDLGPFQTDDDWQAFSVVIPKYNARITCASFEQGIRGLKHRQYRPDLIICDDVEDLESVRTLEGRDKVYNWLTGEVIPAGDQNTRLFVVGNLLHEDSLIMRLRKEIEDKKRSGIFRQYPFFDDDNRVMWPGKFSTPESIEAEKGKIGDEKAWQREYMLQIVPDEDRVVKLKWIKHYDSLPSLTSSEYRFTLTGVDLAISKNEGADYTAMVSIAVFGEKENLRIYVLPNPVNARLSSLESQDRAETLSRTLGNGTPTKLVVENVAYQAAFIEMMNQRGIPTEGFNVQGNDKRARLSLAASLIQSGVVLLPKDSCGELVNQLINFGFQKHDDLTDAFTMAVLKAITIKPKKLSFRRVDDSSDQKPMTPQEQAEEFYRQQQEHDRGLFNMSTEEHLRRAKDQRFWEDK